MRWLAIHPLAQDLAALAGGAGFAPTGAAQSRRRRSLGIAEEVRLMGGARRQPALHRSYEESAAASALRRRPGVGQVGDEVHRLMRDTVGCHQGDLAIDEPFDLVKSPDHGEGMPADGQVGGFQVIVGPLAVNPGQKHAGTICWSHPMLDDVYLRRELLVRRRQPERGPHSPNPWRPGAYRDDAP